MPRFFIAVCFCFGLQARAQFYTNPAKLLAKAGVRSLQVMHDSLRESCQVNYFEYDRQGRELYHELGITLDRDEKAYEGAREIYSVQYYVDDLSGEKTAPDTSFYIYDKKGNFLYTIVKPFEPLRKTDTIPGIPSKKPLKDPVYDQKGRLKQHSYGDVYWPCIRSFPGKHVIKYSYQPNGLVHRMDFVSASGETVMRWFFFYKYEGRYRNQ